MACLWYSVFTLYRCHNQWLKCNGTQGNAIPPPPIYGSEHSPASNCYNARERHTTNVRGPNLNVAFPHLWFCTLTTGHSVHYTCLARHCRLSAVYAVCCLWDVLVICDQHHIQWSRSWVKELRLVFPAWRRCCRSYLLLSVSIDSLLKYVSLCLTYSVFVLFSILIQTRGLTKAKDKTRQFSFQCLNSTTTFRQQRWLTSECGPVRLRSGLNLLVKFCGFGDY